jgi:hypothetical protein
MAEIVADPNGQRNEQPEILPSTTERPDQTQDRTGPRPAAIRYPVLMGIRLARASLLAVALALAAGAACNKTPTTPSGGNVTGPPQGGSPVHYTAIGASDAVGVGGSVLCVPFTDCPNGTGYVAVIARELRAGGLTVSLMNLGIPGAVIGPDYRGGRICAGLDLRHLNTVESDSVGFDNWALLAKVGVNR